MRLIHWSLQCGPLHSHTFFTRSFSLSCCLRHEGDPAGSLPGPLPPVLARYDWRGRATSRCIPSGLIDPPPPSDGITRYKRRKRVDVSSRECSWRFAIENYKLRFLDLLLAEQEAEKKVINSRLAQWSLAKLERDGYCLSGLSAYWLQADRYGKPAAAFLLGPGTALPYHRFENGTQVVLSRVDPLQDPRGQGSVISTTDTEIQVSFNEKYNLDSQTWRLDIFNTDIAYERMCAAVHSLASDPQLQEDDKAGLSSFEVILQGTYLRDILLSSFMTQSEESQEVKQEPVSSPGLFYNDQRIQSWARRYSVSNTPVVVEGDPLVEGLNPTQRRAVAHMIGERVSLVQGPPGTGKTKTIIEAVRLLKAHFQVPQPLLVCTYTNVAVDHLVEGLVAKGLHALRVGYNVKVRPSVLRYTLESKIEVHPRKPELDKIQDRIDYTRKRKFDVEEKLQSVEKYSAQETTLKAVLSKVEKDLERHRAIRQAIYNQIVQDLLNKADVICTTCITAASYPLSMIDFPIVFLDEASMSTEPASLIPLMKGSKHIALIGDHKQLPPVILSKKAQEGGLDLSLFERLIEEKATPTIMLNIQYRMHPALSKFPSSEFYNLSVSDATVSALGEISPMLLPPTSIHLEADPETGHRPSVIFLDHTGNEAIQDRSRVNYNEMKIICAVIEDLLLNNPSMTGHDIGVIAPYAAQISLLKRQLQTNKAYQKQLDSLLGPLRAMQVADIEVKTVDGFEGREKDVIIFSTVRNNASGHIGFLADRRRMNVGLTRARRGLFVIGSVGTLKTIRLGTMMRRERKQDEREVWVRYMDWLTQNGAIKVLRGEMLEKMLGP